MKIILPDLPYSRGALEPLISERTLGFHYDKHHAGYVNKLNELLQSSSFTQDATLVDVIRESYGKSEQQSIFNNAAQVWNHTFYWNSLIPKGKEVLLSEKLMRRIEEDFGGVDALKKELLVNSIAQFGSGWVWLVVDSTTGKLSVMKTSNAETPLTKQNCVPILVLDVWEHAYYLDYQNRRPDYVSAVLESLINWEFASDSYESAI